MTLPPPDEIKKMRGRDILALGVEWFESEGRRYLSDIDYVTKAYGPASIGENMHIRAATSFALSNFIGRAKAKAEDGGRREDGMMASALVSMLRACFVAYPAEPSEASAA